MKRMARTLWFSVPLKVCFEESEMEVMVRGNGMQRRVVLTPIFMLPDGTQFTGRRASPELVDSIYKAARNRKNGQ